MPKYLVNAILFSDNGEYSSPKEVYRGNDPKGALFAWAVASYCAPQRVTITTTLNLSANELINTAKNNLSWLKDICSLDGFPYRWEMVENGINDMLDDKCKNFVDCDFYRQVYPFTIG